MSRLKWEQANRQAKTHRKDNRTLKPTLAQSQYIRALGRRRGVAVRVPNNRLAAPELLLALPHGRSIE